MTKESIEQLIEEFGEPYRQLILDSLTWLNEKEESWQLAEPIDVHEFIADLVERTRK